MNYCEAVEAGKLPPVRQVERLLLDIVRNLYAEAHPTVRVEQPDVRTLAAFGKHFDEHYKADLLSDEQQLEEPDGQTGLEGSE